MNCMQISTLVLLLLLTLVNVNAKGIPCSKYIITKKGDKCSHIYGFSEKKDYYLRYKDLLQYNPTLNCDKKIKPGTIICVEADYNTPMNPPNKTYRIKSGDNCKKIANRLNTTPKILENYNPNIIICDKIKKQVNNVIDYQKDGNYEPVITKNSQLVTIDGN